MVLIAINICVHKPSYDAISLPVQGINFSSRVKGLRVMVKVAETDLLVSLTKNNAQSAQAEKGDTLKVSYEGAWSMGGS